MIKKIRHIVHRILVDYFPKAAISREWKIKYGKPMNWENPQSLNEKIQWLMIHDDMDKWARCADKYQVRDYIKEKGYESILTKLYGVWEKPEDIDYNQLPDKFVIKCNHDSGSTYIIDKSKGFNKEELNEILRKHVSQRFGYSSCELHYTRIKPLIIAEEYLPLDDGLNSSSQVDYKFWCFNGETKYCFVCYDRHGSHAVYDLYTNEPWEPHRIAISKAYSKQQFKDIPAPKNLDKMIEIAKNLSKGFPQVRVDLYNLEGKIYFGELTLTSGNGKMLYFSQEFLNELGSYVKLD